MRMDDSRFPLVCLTCPPVFEPHDIATFRYNLEGLARRGERFIVVCDLTTLAGVPTAIVRKELTAVLNDPKLRPVHERLQIGSANVVQSAAIRGAFTAVLWVWNPAIPMVAVATVAEGIEWCLARLDMAGMPRPA